MAFCRLLLPVLVLSIVQSIATTKVPVFIWGDLDGSPVETSPLSSVAGKDFRGLISEEVKKDPFVLILADETLSIEDFSLKNSDGETAFPYFSRNIRNSLYLPSVDSPLHVLNKLVDPMKANHVKLTENGLSAEIEPNSEKVLVINLKDAQEGESRFDLLRRHNDFIEDMFSKLEKKYGSVIGVYTGHFPSWTIPESHSRVRRQATSQGEVIRVDGLLMRARKILLNNGATTTALSGATNPSTTINGTEQQTKLTFGDTTITFNFDLNNGYWFFKHVTVSQASVTEDLPAAGETNVYSLHTFSYACTDNVTFASINQTKQFTLTLQGVKLQPYFDTANTSSLAFGESFDCNGYFSAPIWASLFVVFILLSIMFFGILMMMDIRTMDRFDDPKGKTITIAAATD